MGKIHSNVFFILFFIYIYIFTHTRNINLLLSDHVAFSLPETTLKSDDKYYFFFKITKIKHVEEQRRLSATAR